MANDGTVKIGVELDDSELKKDINKIPTETKKVEKSFKSLNNSAKIDPKGINEAKNEIDNLGDEAKKTKRETDNLNTSIDKIGSVAKTATGVAVGAITAVTAAFAGAAKKGVEYNALIESYQTSFEVMTGSAEEAADVVQQLKDIGAKTPFELTDLADVTQLLMNYGFTADEAIDRMNMLGDISQGNADKMQRIATAYGQMSSAGKVQLEDVKQMIDFCHAA